MYRTVINFFIWFEFQDGVRFYIYFDSDYELDADSVEEKNKVSEYFGTSFHFYHPCGALDLSM